MNLSLLFAGSARMMLRNKTRTIFMSIGIVVGVASLVFMRAMGVGAETAMLENINRTFSNSSITILAGGGHMGPAAGGPITSLKIEDFEAIEAAVPSVAIWNVMQWVPKQDIRYQGTTRQMSIYGYSANPEMVWQRGVTRGDYFTAEDVASAARVAVIGTNAAAALFGTEDAIGKQIQVGAVPLRIVGVLEQQGIDTHGADKDDEIHVPVTTLMRRILNVEHLFGGRIILDNPSHIEEASKQMNALMRERHSIAPNTPPDFILMTPKLVQDIVSNTNIVLSTYLPAAAGVALLVAGIVIANIMLIAVKERVPEIGIRKAVGADNSQINFQFLTETVVVAVTSGVIGVIFGIAAALSYKAIGTTPMVVTVGSVLLGLGAAVLIGILAGVMPARRASALDPVTALR